jgi:hypothetical protein
MAATDEVGAAHHSISAAYDARSEVEFEATVTRFAFVNPHPFIVVERESTDGPAIEWRLELDNRSELARIGMTAETLDPGDRIQVAGHPSRSDERQLYVRRLEHPDFSYAQAGNRPRIDSRR